MDLTSNFHYIFKDQAGIWGLILLAQMRWKNTNIPLSHLSVGTEIFHVRNDLLHSKYMFTNALGKESLPKGKVFLHCVDEQIICTESAPI